MNDPATVPRAPTPGAAPPAVPAPLVPRELDLAVFRAGDYGERGRYDADDLDRLAAAYDPARHEAPLTIDHDERGPAHGWVRAIRREGDTLVARIGSLSAFIRDALAAGAYRKPSVELFTRHPSTGEPTLGLRAVSLLGAMVPRVKGLPAPGFGGPRGDDDDATPTVIVAAPSALGDAALGLGAARAPEGVAFPATEDAAMPGAAAPRCFAERDLAAATSTIAALRRDGRYLPAWDRAGVPEFLAWLEAMGSVAAPPADSPDAAPAPLLLAFGERAEPAAPAAWFARFLASLSALRLDEVAPAGADEAAPGAAIHRLPCGHARADLSPGSVALHDRALRRLRADPSLAYADALRAVAASAAPR